MLFLPLCRDSCCRSPQDPWQCAFPPYARRKHYASMHTRPARRPSVSFLGKFRDLGTVFSPLLVVTSAASTTCHGTMGRRSIREGNTVKCAKDEFGVSRVRVSCLMLRRKIHTLRRESRLVVFLPPAMSPAAVLHKPPLAMPIPTTCTQEAISSMHTRPARRPPFAFLGKFRDLGRSCSPFVFVSSPVSTSCHGTIGQ
jgi:hypothetical protein